MTRSTVITLRFLAPLIMVSGTASLALCLLARWNPTFSGDVTISQYTQSLDSSLIRQTFHWIAQLTGELQFAILAIVAAITVFVRQQRLDALFLLGTGGSGIVSIILKELVDRPRPSAGIVMQLERNTGASFPSSHVVVFTVFGGFLIFLVVQSKLPKFLKLTVTTGVGTLMGLVDVSRIYEGAHWPSDVYGGFVLGLFLLSILLILYVVIRETFHPGDNPDPETR